MQILLWLLWLWILPIDQVQAQDGLMPPKPKPLNKLEMEKLYREGLERCDSGCVTPFGRYLGASHGVKAWSNCRSTCIRPLYSFLNLDDGNLSLHEVPPRNPRLHYVGVVYQCVEYARRWWMRRQRITFGSIDSAWEIFWLEQGKRIDDGSSFPLTRSVNGQARRAPALGDLLVWAPDRERPRWIHGHVAVVVQVEAEQGWLAVAEENYDNRPWEAPEHHARRLQLHRVGPYWQVTDLAPGAVRSEGGGRILGWVYPTP